MQKERRTNIRTDRQQPGTHENILIHSNKKGRHAATYRQMNIQYNMDMYHTSR